MPQSTLCTLQTTQGQLCKYWVADWLLAGEKVNLGTKQIRAELWELHWPWVGSSPPPMVTIWRYIPAHGPPASLGLGQTTMHHTNSKISWVFLINNRCWEVLCRLTYIILIFRLVDLAQHTLRITMRKCGVGVGSCYIGLLLSSQPFTYRISKLPYRELDLLPICSMLCCARLSLQWLLIDGYGYEDRPWLCKIEMFSSCLQSNRGRSTGS